MMSYVLGVLITVVLAVCFGLLHRGKGARDCHSCVTGEDQPDCATCPINRDPSKLNAGTGTRPPLTLV
jgi:hypothetical protein